MGSTCNLFRCICFGQSRDYWNQWSYLQFPWEKGLPNAPKMYDICLHLCNLSYCWQEEELLRIFNKQVEDDRRIVISRNNLTELHKVRLSCFVSIIND